MYFNTFNEKKVAVLDGHTSQAVTIVRSLGSKGINVFVGSTDKKALSFKSKYVFDTFCYPDPMTNMYNFIDFILDYINEKKINLLIPVTDRTMVPIESSRYLFPQEVILALPDRDAFKIARNKLKTVELANHLNIPVPKTFLLSEDRLKEELDKIGYPIVYKPVFSKLWDGKRGKNLEVSYLYNDQELEHVINNPMKHENVILQEYVNGIGYGNEILAHKGEILVLFQHKRLREFPPTGGASTYRESTPIDPLLYDYSMRIVKELDWTGVLMIEYKRNTQKRIDYLMEINGRFWGSLPLSAAAGVDFPFCLYNLLINNKKCSIKEYLYGVKCRSLSRDIYWIETVLRGNYKRISENDPSRFSAMIALLSFLNFRSNYDLQSFDDIGPGIWEIFFLMKKYLRRLFGKEKYIIQ